MNGGITIGSFMPPSSAMFACWFKSRSQVIRSGIGCCWGFELELNLKSIDVDGKVGRSRLSIFGWWSGSLSGQLIVGQRLRGGQRRRGVCGVLSVEWLTCIWMETASLGAYTMGLDDRS